MLLHLVRLQPYTHGVGLHTGRLNITHAIDTLEGRNDVDVGIVGQEDVVVASVLGGKREHDDV